MLTIIYKYLIKNIDKLLHLLIGYTLVLTVCNITGSVLIPVIIGTTIGLGKEIFDYVKKYNDMPELVKDFLTTEVGCLFAVLLYQIFN